MNNFYWSENKMYLYNLLGNIVAMHDLKISISDVSSISDGAPSFELVSESDSYYLFLPNSWRNYGEETTKYTLIKSEEYGTVEDYIIFESIELFIYYLLENKL